LHWPGRKTEITPEHPNPKIWKISSAFRVPALLGARIGEIRIFRGHEKGVLKAFQKWPDASSRCVKVVPTGTAGSCYWLPQRRFQDPPEPWFW
jgi:hypothetical protein